MHLRGQVPPPPPPGPTPLNEVFAFLVSGADDNGRHGVYMCKTTVQCNGKPVFVTNNYGSDYMLFQPTGRSSWWISDYEDDCDEAGYIHVYGYTCTQSPAGSGCVGEWREWMEGSGWFSEEKWRANSDIKVVEWSQAQQTAAENERQVREDDCR